MSQIDSTEARLNTHEQICAERYRGIELRMTNIDDRFDRLESNVEDIKNTTTKSLSEIKSMLSAAKDEKFKVMITSTATVIVSLLAMLGYIVLHLPK